MKNLKELQNHTMHMLRTNWDFLVTGLLNNTYGRKNAKIAYLKKRLNYLVAMTQEDIQRQGASANIQNEEHLALHRAAHRYVISLLESYDNNTISRIHEEHDVRSGHTKHTSNLDRAYGRTMATTVDSFYRQPTPQLIDPRIVRDRLIAAGILSHR